ncbi:MAG: DUF2905 domain-containing protein [Acidobacteriota bacterium]
MKLISNLLLLFGFFIIILGLFFRYFEKFKFIGKLPGDILIKKGNFTFYFPLATSILISILLTILLNLLFKFFKK